jgi:2-keto-4-pentenoate hydratase/2-oxohepta-3-ene-1,7-dioic acid hydratase in catechol pathway
VQGEQVVDVSAALEALPALRYPFPSHDVFIAHLDALRPGIAQAAVTGQRHSVAAVHYDPPVANPGKIIGAPINYKAHAQESAQDANIGHGRAITTIGDWGMFLKAGTSLIGVSDDIVLRFGDRRNDHEVELAVIIGKTCRQVKASEAMAHVAGYVVMNDISVPHGSFYRPSMRFKCRDGSCPMGAFIARDAIANPDALTVKVAIDGVVVQQTDTGGRIRSVAQLLVDVTEFMTLNPGDILSIGVSAHAPRAQSGQRVTITMGGVGEIENTLMSESSV